MIRAPRWSLATVGALLALATASCSGSPAAGLDAGPDSGHLGPGSADASTTPEPDAAGGASDSSVTEPPDAAVVVGADASAAGLDAAAAVLKAACASPTLVNGAVIPVNSSYLERSALAWNGSAAAVIYSSKGDAGYEEVKLQGLSRAGQLSGSAVQVGTAVASPSFALTPSGGGFIGCWDNATVSTNLACAFVDSGGTVTAGFTVTGTRPSLATGTGGAVLVYKGASAVRAQALTAAAAAGASSCDVVTPARDWNSIAATPSGYAVASGTEAARLDLYRLTSTLQPQGSSVAIKASSWQGRSVALATSGTKLAAVWKHNTGTAYEIDAALVSETNVVTGPFAVAPDQTYGEVGAAGGLDSFALTWSAFNGYIGYRAVDATGTPLGSVVHAFPNVGWDDNPHCIVAVDDGFLLSVSQTMMGPTQIALVHLGCP